MDKHNEERMEEAYDEAELSDDEFEELSSNDMFDRVESNDPSLTKLEVCLPPLDHRHLERSSTAINRNTQLKSLRFGNYSEGINEAQVVNLFLGIACNQSIKRIHFRDCRASSVGNACRILTPLFKRNQVERIWIDNRQLSINSTRLLATSLAEFDSLKEFALTPQASFQHDPENEQVASELIQSLSGHSRLRKLDLSRTNLGKLGCSALVDLLRNPSINLRVLDLTYNSLGDEEAAALSSGMAGNVSLKEINLSNNTGITEAGWQALFGTLSNSSCRLERLSLIDNDINDAAAQSLSSALASNTTIKTLDLGEIQGITLTGWRVLFEFLRSPTCALENLDLRYNQLNDEVMVSLTEALATNGSLKSLDLSNSNRITGATWQRLFSTVLTNPSSELEKLDLGSCDNINDAAIRSLANALVNNSKLKVLILNGNDLITNVGWETFVAVLESPNTSLEKLDLGDNDVDDATRTLFMNSLANNKKLKELLFFIFFHSDDWEPPLSVLCDTTSIMSTYNSNHILEVLGDEDDWPEEFESLLQINKEYTPSQAARLKIIKTHFKEGFSTHPFVDIDLNVLPHAMAWMGRDGRAGEDDGHYFSFIESISSLFENVN